MEKIDVDRKKNKILVKKIIIFFLMVLLGNFLLVKTNDVYDFIYKDEIEYRKNLVLLEIKDIKLPGSNELVAPHLQPWYKTKERIWFTKQFKEKYDARSIVMFYRREFLANGWSDLTHERTINHSTGRELNDTYTSTKDDFFVNLSFPTLLKNPKDVYVDFDGLTPSRDTTVYYFILMPVRKDQW